jgi:hypothetical protein
MNQDIHQLNEYRCLLIGSKVNQNKETIMSKETKETVQVSLKFGSTKDVETEVIAMAETIGDKDVSRSDEVKNRHDYDKLKVKAQDEWLRFRTKCAKIESVITAVFGGGNNKDVRRNARKDFRLASEFLSTALKGYKVNPTHKSYTILKEALTGFADTFYGANYVLRCLEAEALGEELPEQSKSKTVGTHWFTMKKQLEILTAEEAELKVEQIKEDAKKLVADAEWHPIKEVK